MRLIYLLPGWVSDGLSVLYTTRSYSFLSSAGYETQCLLHVSKCHSPVWFYSGPLNLPGSLGKSQELQSPPGTHCFVNALQSWADMVWVWSVLFRENVSIQSLAQWEGSRQSCVLDLWLAPLLMTREARRPGDPTINDSILAAA